MAGAEGPPGDNLYVQNLPPDITDAVITSIFAAVGYTVVESRVLPVNANGNGMCGAMVRFSSFEEAMLVRQNLDGTDLPGFDMPLQIRYADKTDASDAKGQGKSGYGKAPKGKWQSSEQQWSGNDEASQMLEMLKVMTQGKGMDKGKGKGKPKGGGRGYTMQDIVDGFVHSGGLPGHGLNKNDDHCLYVHGLPADCDDFVLYQMFSPFGAIAPNGVKTMKFPDGSCKGVGFINYVNPESVQVAGLTLHDTPKPSGGTIQCHPKRGSAAAAAGKGSSGQSMTNDGYAGVMAAAANLLSAGNVSIK